MFVSGFKEILSNLVKCVCIHRDSFHVVTRFQGVLGCWIIVRTIHQL